MTLVAEHPQERAWREAEAETVALMGSINVAVAGLVRVIRHLIDTEGWAGHGIQSVEHWVTWKAGISRDRAQRLVRIARRMHELPHCWELFEAGRLTEDAMVRIARRVPAERDAEVASFAPTMLISQLRRVLASCPEIPLPTDPPKHCRNDNGPLWFSMHSTADGSLRGQFTLPTAEAATFRASLDAARDSVFKERNGVDGDEEIEGASPWSVTWADALVRMAEAGLDRLDADCCRTGHPGERHKVVLHFDVDEHGALGPGQLHLGPIVPDTVARYLACDADVMVAAYQAGKLIGISPTERTVSRPLRRAIERRDQGCSHPLCEQRRWLHIHHIEFWEHGGVTVPENLIALCPLHHRELHQGLFSIEGNPEERTVRFLDTWGRPIAPPELGAVAPPPAATTTQYTSPYGERLDSRWFSWN